MLEFEVLPLFARFNIVFSLAIVVVLGLRRPIRQMFGAGASYGMWCLAPIAALVSLLPGKVIELVIQGTPVLIGPGASSTKAVVPTVSQASPGLSMLNGSADLVSLALLAWLLGCLAVLGLMVSRHVRFYGQVGQLLPLRDSPLLYHSTNPKVGPVALGLLSPRIILPADFETRFTQEEGRMVVAHEMVHLRRGDILVNWILTGVQCLCWYNPLVHIAASYLRIDQEMACDQVVVLRRPDARHAYAQALLKSHMANAPLPIGCHWTPGAAGLLKSRISMLLTPPKSRWFRWVGLALVVTLSFGVGAAIWSTRPTTYRYVDEEKATASAAPVTAAAMPAPLSKDALAKRAQFRERVLERDGVKMLSHVSRQDAYGQTGGEPLMRAVMAGDAATVQQLIDAGAEVDLGALGQGTPLIAAVRRHDMKMVKLLLARRANPNLGAFGDGNPLIIAAAHGYSDIAQVLIDQGASINVVIPADETPLITAARRGQLSMVKLLVKRGADVNLSADTYNGNIADLQTPLKAARRAGHDDIAAYLAGAGARS